MSNPTAPFLKLFKFEELWTMLFLITSKSPWEIVLPLVYLAFLYISETLLPINSWLYLVSSVALPDFNVEATSLNDRVLLLSVPLNLVYT